MKAEIMKMDPIGLARPPSELADLIRGDFKQAREAAERASMPHFRDAGEKLLEVKKQLPHGQFTRWIEENIEVSRKQANVWMRLAAQKEPAGSFSSLAEFAQQTKKARKAPNRPPESPLVGAGASGTATPRLAQEECDRVDEADRETELLIIGTGFKTLSRICHPDKGGPAEQMRRLIAARDRLKQKV